MTKEELTAKCPGVPEGAIMALLEYCYKPYEEVKDRAKRAVADGDFSLWPPVGKGE